LAATLDKKAKKVPLIKNQNQKSKINSGYQFSKSSFVSGIKTDLC
jgi:hypothetical protein